MEEKRRTKRFSLAEAIQHLTDEDSWVWTGAEITMIPPKPDNLTDEDSGDEDGKTSNINNLNGRLLQAEVEVSVKQSGPSSITPQSFYGRKTDVSAQLNYEVDGETSETENIVQVQNQSEIHRIKRKRTVFQNKICDSDSSEEGQGNEGNVRASEKTKAVKSKAKRSKGVSKTTQWKFSAKDFSSRDREAVKLQNIAAASIVDKTPVAFFEDFYDIHLVNLIVTQTNLYASQKGDHNFTTNSDEIKAFLTILMISGYCDVYSYRNFWSVDLDVRNEMVATLMPRNRFQLIMKYLHLADNDKVDEHKDDRFYKVRSYLDYIRTRCLQQYLGENRLSIDETMVPYFGRHSLKQYIKNKPIKFGFKLWTLASSDGYVINTIPYQGKGATYDAELGLGGSVVQDLLVDLPPLPEEGRDLYFDNFFTSLNLIEKLGNQGYTATGTLRADRLCGAPFDMSKVNSRAPRGSYNSVVASSSTTRHKICMVLWKDGSLVKLASNKYGAEPTQTVQRYSKVEHKYIPLTQPDIIKMYNLGMGGVDRSDQNVSVYRVNIRKKAWWFPLFSYGLNLSLVNSYYLYKHSDAYIKEKLPFIEFIRRIVDVYAAKYKYERSNRQGHMQRAVAVNEVRYDGMNHWPAENPTQRRCAACSMKVKFICTKCNVGLHIRCFQDYHKM